MRWLFCGMMLAWSSVLPGADGKTGDLLGRIVLDGQEPVPVLPRIVPNRGVVAPNGFADESLLVDPQSRGVANVFVYLKSFTPPADFPTPPVPSVWAKIEASNHRFEPHAQIIRAGQQVMAEAVNMVTNAHYQPLRNQSWNMLLDGKVGRDVTFGFKQAETIPVRIVSNIYTWMSCYVLPLDHPFAAVTDPQGNFAIRGLPAGDYEFRVWHEKTGYLEKSWKLKVEAGEVSLLPPLRVPLAVFLPPPANP